MRLRVLGATDLEGADGALRTVIAQPKRLAILSYLAVAAPRGFHRRDSLLALFWPELGADESRRALRQALHFLRHEIGGEVVVARGDEVGANADVLWCDAIAFGDALDAGRLADALALYRGDLLDGFYVADVSPDFQYWLDGERARLRRSAASAAWQLSDEADALGNGVAAAHWARRAAALAPDDEGAIRKVVRLLDRLGDRAGALRAYDDFSQRLAAELDAEPSAETKALLRAVRAREDVALGGPASSVRSPEKDAGDGPHDVPEAGGRSPESGGARARQAVAPTRAGGQRSSRRRRLTPLWLASTVGIVGLVVATLAYSRHAHAAADSPLFAVGEIRAANGADSSQLARALPELLATDLARVAGLRVVSRARLYELLGQLGGSAQHPPAFSDAARQAGARELLEGVLYGGAGKNLTLDLRRVDIASGVVRKAYRVEASEVFALADSATRAVAAAMRLTPPAQPVTSVTTTSLVAQRLYEEGLRAFYRNDARGADRLFTSALAEDSTFAMAAYYSALSVQYSDLPLAFERLGRAVRTSIHASEHDRLLIEQMWADFNNDPRNVALAESLAVRYPSEPDGELALGNALMWSGDFLGAVTHLRRVIAADSLALRASVPRCHACDAYYTAVVAYLQADSLGAAERMARTWQRDQPRSPVPWLLLVRVLSQSDRRAEALDAQRQALALDPGVIDEPASLVQLAIRAGDFAQADRILAERIRNGAPEARADALWWSALSLRNQGREREALTIIRRLATLRADRRSPDDSANRHPSQYAARLSEAQVLFELRRFGDALALATALVDTSWLGSQRSAGGLARHRAWTLTHAGTAAGALGDTVRLAAFADSVESAGRLSAYGRDQRLFHHLRGLLFDARHEPNEAIDEYRRAMYSPTSGYTRTNLELGRLLMNARRWNEAIAVIRPALHGNLDASNVYVTRTELEELLARAFDGAGRTDSATAYYRLVAAAWSAGDPPYRARAGEARQRLVALGR